MVVQGIAERARREGAAFTAHLREPLFRNAYALMASTIATGMVGIVFWAVAARRYDATTVGENSALIAAMMTVSTFAQFDLAAMLLRFLPRWRHTARRAVWTSYGVATAGALVGGGGFVAVTNHLEGNLGLLRDGGLAVLFCGAVVAWGIFAIQDGVLTGLSRAPVVPVENTLFGVGKLALLALFAVGWSHWGIFLAWTIPVAISLLPINWLIFRRYLPLHEQRPPHPEHLDRAMVVRYIAYDYAGALCGALTTIAMPLLIIAVLGADASGHFYVAWTLVLVVDTIALSLGSSLVVEGSFDPARLERDARHVLRRGAMLVGPAILVVLVFAPLLLSVFGSGYSEAATMTLRVLVLGIIPRSVVIVYTSIARVLGDVRPVLIVVVATTALIGSGVVVLASLFGLVGAAAGWVFGYTVAAIVVTPRLRHALRPRPALDLVAAG